MEASGSSVRGTNSHEIGRYFLHFLPFQQQLVAVGLIKGAPSAACMWTSVPRNDIHKPEWNMKYQVSTDAWTCKKSERIGGFSHRVMWNIWCGLWASEEGKQAEEEKEEGRRAKLRLAVKQKQNPKKKKVKTTAFGETYWFRCHYKRLLHSIAALASHGSPQCGECVCAHGRPHHAKTKHICVCSSEP